MEVTAAVIGRRVGGAVRVALDLGSLSWAAVNTNGNGLGNNGKCFLQHAKIQIKEECYRY